MLAFPQFDRGFILDTDASGVGLGAVLAQNPTVPREELWRDRNGSTRCSLGREAHRYYLYGHHCDVFSDHEALQSLLNTPHPSGKLARWGLALQEVDLAIYYKPGKLNVLADALSQAPVSTENEIPLVPAENLVAMVMGPRD